MVRRPVCIIIVCTNVYGIAYGQTKLHVLLMLGASVLQTEQYNELAGSVHRDVLSDRLLPHYCHIQVSCWRAPARPHVF